MPSKTKDLNRWYQFNRKELDIQNDIFLEVWICRSSLMYNPSQQKEGSEERKYEHSTSQVKLSVFYYPHQAVWSRLHQLTYVFDCSTVMGHHQCGSWKYKFRIVEKHFKSMRRKQRTVDRDLNLAPVRWWFSLFLRLCISWSTVASNSLPRGSSGLLDYSLYPLKC